MIRRYDVVVVGGGLSGLSTALSVNTTSMRAASRGPRVLVLERSPIIGGLAKTLAVEPHTYADTGPHRFHTRIPGLLDEVRELVPMMVEKRTSHIYMSGRMFKYPLEGINVAALMPPHITLSIFLDYLKAIISRSRWSDANFEEWVVSRFGRRIYDIYFGPYTEKVWGIPCNQISADWADQRIKLLNLKETIVGMLNPKSRAREKLVSLFHYPKSGGIGAISDAMAHRIREQGGRILTGSTVVGLESKGGGVNVTFEKEGKARSVAAKAVVSTMPLTRLPAITSMGGDATAFKSAKALRFRAIVFVYIIVGKERITNDHWIYFPEREAVFNRISEGKNFSPGLVKGPRTVLCAEITCDYGDELWSMEKKALADMVVEQMESIDLLSRNEVKGYYVHREREAYPIYNVGYQHNLNNLMEWAMELDRVIPLGRSGLFRYNNMDHSIRMGEIAGGYVSKALSGRISMADAKVATVKEAMGVLRKEYLG